MSPVSDRLRGWGGVTAMGVACAVTAALTLLPLAHSGAGSADGGRLVAPHGTTAVPAKAAKCQDGDAPEASLPASAATGPIVADMQRRADRRLIVGVDQNSYDWGYLDPESNAFEGFDIDIARAIAKNIYGSETAVKFQPVSTAQRIPALQNGTVDVIVRTMTISCDRREDIDFSSAYFKAGQQVLAPKSSEITGYNETLKGKRVCTATGSSAVQALEGDKRNGAFGAVYWDSANNEGNKPAGQSAADLSVPNQLDCLVRLQLGLVDAIVTDNSLAAGQAAQDPSVMLKGPPFTTEYYGVATKLSKTGDNDLVRRINKVLEEYRAGGADSPWMRSYNKWLKTGLPGIAGPPAPTYKSN